MNKDNTFTQRLERFLAGKGFYIVLFVCVCVIGLSAWSLFSSGVFDKPDVPVDAPPDIKTDVPNTPDRTVGEDTEKNDGTASVWKNTEPEPENDEPADAPVPEDIPVSVTLPADTPVKTEPVFKMPLSGDVTWSFSDSRLQYSKTMGDWRTHNGVDIAADIGTDVAAISDGTVKKIYSDDLLGTTVVIDHRNGIFSAYSNLDAAVSVSEGDSVVCGDIIGKVGTTAIGECKEVSHLHLSMEKDGKACDPFDYLQ